ncbi:hypothetical protein MIR68_003222 [Amoeboaphelidium protococcarum]|nr:hypothetical protein MIR68_003222 [Amoeboaphelidium protococcarum]
MASEVIYTFVIGAVILLVLYVLFWALQGGRLYKSKRRIIMTGGMGKTRLLTLVKYGKQMDTTPSTKANEYTGTDFTLIDVPSHPKLIDQYRAYMSQVVYLVNADRVNVEVARDLYTVLIRMDRKGKMLLLITFLQEYAASDQKTALQKLNQELLAYDQIVATSTQIDPSSEASDQKKLSPIIITESFDISQLESPKVQVQCINMKSVTRREILNLL